MPLEPAIRLVGQLNLLAHTPVSAELAAHTLAEHGPVQHVIDPDGLLGLDPLHASDLLPALRALQLLSPGGWLLALPRPGRLGPLRGPATFHTLALAASVALVRRDGGLGLVPHPVGAGLQWQLCPAQTPVPPPDPGEAQRELSATVLAVGRELADLDLVSTGATRSRRVDHGVDLLPAGYPGRHLAVADRALRLLVAAELALESPGATLSLHSDLRRGQALEQLRAVAADAVVAACAWPEQA